MIRLLPFILIPILIIGGLGFWRYTATKQSLITPILSQADQGPMEVPKTLPNASLEDKVKSLEDVVTKLVTQINSLKSPGNSTQTTSQTTSSDVKLSSLEAAITELKARVSSLEKATPAPVSTTSFKAPLYIPLGSAGQTTDTNWASLNTFQISLDPASYSGYTSMQLEVNMRLNQPGGQVYARLYNSSNSSSVASEVSSTSTTSSVATSSIFTLPSGSKNYVLQAKSKDGSLIFIDYARIKVNF